MAGTGVPILNPEGKLVRIDPADVEKATTEGGYSVPRPERVAEEEALREQAIVAQEHPVIAATLGNPAFQAATSGAFSGLTAGLGPAAVSAAGGEDFSKEYGQRLEQIKTANPGTYKAGELAGMVGGAYLGGAAGGAARLLPSAGIDALGAGAEGLAAKYLGGLATRGALGRAAASGLGFAARGAVEGGLYNAANEFSEETLGDPALNAQKIILAGGEGGVAGALFGFGLGATGSLARSGTTYALGKIGEHAGSLEGLANEQRFKALSPGVKFTREANAFVKGGTREIGDVLGRYGVVGDDLKTAIAEGHPADILPKISAAKNQVGEAIGEVVTKSPARVTWGELEKHVDDVVSPLRAKIGHGGIADSVQAAGDDLRAKLGIDARIQELIQTGFKPEEAVAAVRKTPIPIQDVFAQRKALDDLIYREGSPVNPSPRVGELRALRGKIDDSIVGSIEQAGKDAGDELAGAKLRQLKNDYQSLRISEKAARNTTDAYQANRNFGMSDYLSGIAGAAFGGPVGGIALGAANKFMRAHGNAIASVALDKLSTMTATINAIQKANKAVDAAVSGLTGSQVTGIKRLVSEASTGAKAPLAKRYADAVKHVGELKTDPDVLARITEAASMPHAPNTAAAMSAAAATRLQYLVNRLPPSLNRPTLGVPNRPARASMPEMQRFVRAYENARTGGAIALDSMAGGRVRREDIMALKEMSPALFAELQSKALEAAAAVTSTGKKRMTHEQRLRMGILLDSVTDPSLEASTKATLQANLAQANEQQKQGASPVPSRPIDIKPESSGLDRIEDR